MDTDTPPFVQALFSMKTKLAVAAAVFVLLLGTALYAPARIDPVAWEAAPGHVYPANEDLRRMEALPLPQAEDVAVDALGRVYGGTVDGRVLRTTADGAGTELFAETGGRALGLAWHPDGRLIVADCWKGLLAISPDGAEVEVLATEAGGVPFKFTDDVDVAPDGRIFFTDASDLFDQREYMLDFFDGRPHGRLLMHHEGETTVLLDGLHFANGVAVSPDGSYVLVNETWRYRVIRYWLEGDEAGTSEVFADHLPGFPDGISSDGRGTYWVAIFSPRKAIADWLAPRPRLRVAVSRLPKPLLPKPIAWGYVMALDGSGEVVATLQDPGGEAIHPVTSVERVGDELYLGSLDADHAGVVGVPDGMQQRKRMAVTIDDLPWVGWSRDGRAAGNERILEALTSRGVPATGFVVCDRTAPPHPILRSWLDAGMELANHHESHASLNHVDPDAYVAGIESCHAELGALSPDATRFWRFPYLFNGKERAVRDRVAADLRRLGLTTGRVSIDNHEWKLAELYGEALKEGDADAAAAIASYYVDHMADAAANFREVAGRKLGRDLDHVLLLHANQLNADHLGTVLDRLAAEGWEFVPLDEALADPAYRRPDEYVGPWGISWLYRIAPVDDDRPWDNRTWDEIQGLNP